MQQEGHQHDENCSHGHHHHHEEEHHHHHHNHSHSHGHDHNHSHAIFPSFQDLKQTIVQLQEQAIYLFKFSMQNEHSKRLLIHSAVLLALFVCFVLFSIFFSKSLLFFVVTFHTLQRFLHHLITLVTRTIAANPVATKAATMGGMVPAFSFGFERLEVLLRFANAIFVIFFSLAFSTEAVKRVLEPHEISM